MDSLSCVSSGDGRRFVAAPLRAILFAGLCLQLAACAPGQSAPTASIASAPGPARSSLRAEVDDFRTTVAEGALVGAIAGGILGAITGGGDPRRIAAGAIAGGVVGAAGGYMIAGQKQEFASREAALDAIIADGRQRTAKLTSLNQSADRLVKQRRGELARITASSASAEQKATERRRVAAELEADRKDIDDALVISKKNTAVILANVREFRQKNPGVVSKQLDDLVGEQQKGERSLGEFAEQINKAVIESTRVNGQV